MASLNRPSVQVLRTTVTLVYGSSFIHPIESNAITIAFSYVGICGLVCSQVQRAHNLLPT